MIRILKLKTWALALACSIVIEGLCAAALSRLDNDGVLVRGVQFFHQPAGFLALLCVPELDTGRASTAEETAAIAIIFLIGWLQWWIISYVGIGTLRILFRDRVDNRKLKAACVAGE